MLINTYKTGINSIKNVSYFNIEAKVNIVLIINLLVYNNIPKIGFFNVNF